MGQTPTVSLFERALAGDADAQYKVGNMYNSGNPYNSADEGVPQDYEIAFIWYRRAADQGHARAQNNVGYMYAVGRWVPQDKAEAVRWYRKAAEQGEIVAQANLGVELIQTLRSEAHMWLNLAASHTRSEDEREQWGNLRDLIAKKMTPAQIADAQRRAREWRPKPTTSAR